jgi:sodium-dependent dicarboxylate transporter 2/3/5
MNLDIFIQYIWLRLPIFLIFANSYLVYRLLVSSQLTDIFVQRVINKSQGNMTHVILFILIAGALLSFFIPNAVTVLILLPVLKQIEKQITDSDLSENQISSISTALGLSAIYGANIGGMGSLVGSPANLILIGALDLLSGKCTIAITFFNWFLWSIPLVFCFLFSAYCVIRMLVLPSLSKMPDFKFTKQTPLNFQQSASLKLFIWFIVFWIFHAIGYQKFADYQSCQSFICLIFVFCFTFHLFQKRLLSFDQLMRGVPIRGCMVLIVFACLMFLVQWFHLDQMASRYFDKSISTSQSTTGLVLWVTGVSIFLTEFLSNTIVSTALFPIVYQMAQLNDIMPLVLMIPVSVASTCAFMTPIATPCNAFVYGEIKGIRLRTMIICGMVLNALCVICVTFWIPVCIPVIYHSTTMGFSP